MSVERDMPSGRHPGRASQTINLIAESDWQRQRVINEHKIMEKILRHKQYCLAATYIGIIVLILNAVGLAYIGVNGWQWFLFGALVIWALDYLYRTSDWPIGASKAKAGAVEHRPVSVD